MGGGDVEGWAGEAVGGGKLGGEEEGEEELGFAGAAGERRGGWLVCLGWEGRMGGWAKGDTSRRLFR